MSESNEELLKISLTVAVAFWIDKLRDTSFEYRQKRAAVCVQEIAAHGDIILYRGGKKESTGEAFNYLAEGVAIGALQPGGIKIFGLHFTEDSCTGLPPPVPYYPPNLSLEKKEQKEHMAKATPKTPPKKAKAGTSKAKPKPKAASKARTKKPKA